MLARRAATTPGSSPRVRGKLRRCDCRVGRGGLIPARAGKRQSAAHRQAECGLIPARAGKTRGARGGGGGVPAHPRACGENIHRRLPRVQARGSSPRVRGKRHSLLGPHAFSGLIPARAGKTATQFVWRGPDSAHPRACGENPDRVLWQVMGGGSSPRVRGKPVRMGRPSASTRLIPARAGKTAGNPVSQAHRRAHPRACGENGVGEEAVAFGAGSSPRVRGKLEERRESRGQGRLIPARAGKTRPGCPRPPSRSAHPRACGENLRILDDNPGPEGSSPRVRGKRPFCGPACRP